MKGKVGEVSKTDWKVRQITKTEIKFFNTGQIDVNAKIKAEVMKDGKLIEEKVGRQFRDHMTPAKASKIRAERIEGRDLPNRVKRELERKKKEQELNRWTIDRLWEEYKRYRPDLKGIRTMASST